MVAIKKISNTTRISTAIPEKTFELLRKEEWRIFTDHKNTQDVLMEHLASKGLGEISRTNITHNSRTVPVFIVSFMEVQWLRKNRASAGYQFTIYHRKNNNYVWRIWNEGKKGPGEIAKKSFEKAEFKFDSPSGVIVKCSIPRK